MDKEKEVIEILKKTYCRLKPSSVSGVGVFAVRDIPKNINPFEGAKNQEWQDIEMSELKGLNEEVLRMINDFFVTEKNGKIWIPEYGLNGMDISFFLNHSKNPNLKTINNGDNFITLRDIKKGEELTVSYETYDPVTDTKNYK